MSAREELATAASAVDDVTVSEYFRQTTTPGHGFVRLDVANRDDTGFGFMCSWQVCVLLPSSQNSAEKWIDKHLDDLLAALKPEGVVTSAQPVVLQVDAGSIPALVITVIRAKE